jgi:hypothetical protein
MGGGGDFGSPWSPAQSDTLSVHYRNAGRDPRHHRVGDVS